MGRQLALGLLFIVSLSANSLAQSRLDFQRMVAHWSEYGDPQYVEFIKEARPEIAQVGFYGAHFWSLSHTKFGKGYPAHFPVVGLDECGKWFEDLNGKLHKNGCKVVGHFNVEFLVGDPDSPEGPRGFFEFYRDHWDEKRLGPRPVENPLDLLEKDAEGMPRKTKNYGIGGMNEYWGCLNNFNWRKVLKAWVKVGIERGVDGFISNYYYRHNCLCSHCQDGFRQYLKERFSDEELKRHFDIAELAKHRFKEIGGWHNPKESTRFRREMLRFSQIACKEAYDEVFVKFGRSLKKDLILAQWNHLGDFNQISGDERCLLPKEMWGRDEDYTWYSTGGSAHFTDLEAGILGEGTLQARYIRGAFDGKPFTLGKYENTRTRVAIAELAANGGAAMGFYTRFKDPLARKEIVRYFHFLEKNAGLYRGQRSHAEVILLFPRSHVHHGDLKPLEKFKAWGKELLDRHVLFDVLPDDMALSPGFEAKRVLDPGKDAYVLPKDLSGFNAPKTVRVSASRSKEGDIIVHLVNYNRVEPATKRSAGRGIVDESPIPADDVQMDLSLPKEFIPGKIEFLSPEDAEPVLIRGSVENGRLRCTVPRFLVYGIVRIRKS